MSLIISIIIALVTLLVGIWQFQKSRTAELKKALIIQKNEKIWELIEFVQEIESNAFQRVENFHQRKEHTIAASDLSSFMSKVMFFSGEDKDTQKKFTKAIGDHLNNIAKNYSIVTKGIIDGDQDKILSSTKEILVLIKAILNYIILDRVNSHLDYETNVRPDLTGTKEVVGEIYSNFMKNN